MVKPQEERKTNTPHPVNTALLNNARWVGRIEWGINDKESYISALANCKAVFHAVGQFQIQLSRKIVDGFKKKIETHFKISKLDDLSQGPGQ